MTTQEVTTKDMLTHLQKIRETHGEETYEETRRDIARAMILKDNGDKFISNAFPDYDLDELRAEAEANQKVAVEAVGGDPDKDTPPEQMMMNMMRASIPNLKNQAQYNLFMGAFDGLRGYLNAVFGDDIAGANKARDALDQALDMAPKLQAIASKLSEMPEELRSKAAEAFTEAPKEFHEFDVQKRLLMELKGIDARSTLNVWYRDNKEAMDKIVDQRLRDDLLDSIRKKRNTLDAQEAD